MLIVAQPDLGTSVDIVLIATAILFRRRFLVEMAGGRRSSARFARTLSAHLPRLVSPGAT